jgi:hypothetical protein
VKDCCFASKEDFRRIHPIRQNDCGFLFPKREVIPGGDVRSVEYPRVGCFGDCGSEGSFFGESVERGIEFNRCIQHVFFLFRHFSNAYSLFCGDNSNRLVENQSDEHSVLLVMAGRISEIANRARKKEQDVEMFFNGVKPTSERKSTR